MSQTPRSLWSGGSESRVLLIRRVPRVAALWALCTSGGLAHIDRLRWPVRRSLRLRGPSVESACKPRRLISAPECAGTRRCDAPWRRTTCGSYVQFRAGWGSASACGCPLERLAQVPQPRNTLQPVRRRVEPAGERNGSLRRRERIEPIQQDSRRTDEAALLRRLLTGDDRASKSGLHTGLDHGSRDQLSGSSLVRTVRDHQQLDLHGYGRYLPSQRNLP